MSAPLILTLLLAEEDQARFDELRRAHFPPEHYRVGAHVTLFHALPGGDLEAISHVLGLVAAGQAAFAVEVTGVRSLGRGVAFELHSAVLSGLRGRLAALWHDGLTAQDRQGFRAHVTIQNKVSPEVARGLLEQMRAGFTPYSVRAVGLGLWRYLGGSWEGVGTWGFVEGVG